jgi:hypothetical protein
LLVKRLGSNPTLRDGKLKNWLRSDPNYENAKPNQRVNATSFSL